MIPLGDAPPVMQGIAVLIIAPAVALAIGGPELRKWVALLRGDEHVDKSKKKWTHPEP